VAPSITSDQSAVTIVEISDPTVIGAGIELIDQDVVRLQSMPQRARRVIVRLEAAACRPELFNDRKEERVAAQVELLEIRLATLGVADDFEPSRTDRSRQAQCRIVNIAEDYALSKIGDLLYVSDLCRVAGVSERTLEYAFKEVIGLTPVTYLIRVRLHRVGEALLAATRGSTTISAKALKWGFWHFGEFSRAYKDCFGELPSDTLRRKPGEQQR